MTTKPTKNDDKTYGSDMGTLARWKLYAEMTDLGEIARRYFVMNFFDGVLTVLGIVIGSFILYLGQDPPLHLSPTQLQIVVPALATSIAIGISGISGGYLSERAERKRNIIEMHKAMADIEPNTNDADQSFKEEDYYPVKPIKEFEERELNNSTVEHISVDPVSPVTEQKTGERKREKTLAERAERYASFIASLINGISPAVGGFAVIIPFFFSKMGLDTDWIVYTISFALIAVLLFGLGAYLAKISKDSIMKYGVKMVLVGILTAGLAFLLSLFNIS